MSFIRNLQRANESTRRAVAIGVALVATVGIGGLWLFSGGLSLGALGEGGEESAAEDGAAASPFEIFADEVRNIAGGLREQFGGENLFSNAIEEEGGAKASSSVSIPPLTIGASSSATSTQESQQSTSTRSDFVVE